MPKELSPVEAELLEESAFFVELAERYRTEGRSALDGVEIEEPLDDFIDALLADYPADQAVAA